MKFIISFLISFCLTFFAHAQELKRGKIVSMGDSLPVVGAHIINLQNNQLAISDDLGAFEIMVQKGDTLVISNVSYNTKLVRVGIEKILRITLKAAQIQLEEIRVSNIPETEAAFRRKLINMDPPVEESFVPFGVTAGKPIGPIPKNYDPAYTNSLKYAVNKPISFIVKKLSKSHKQKVKYYELKNNQKTALMDSKKYNRELVTELTGLEGEELSDFIQFIDLDEAFVTQSSEYDIAVRILEEFESFKNRG